jgi:hypothetical protein
MAMKGPLLLFFLGQAAGLATHANPIRKIVTLMQDMQKQIEAEVETEKELFEKFMCICTEYPSELKDTIDAATKTAEEMTGAVESEKAEKARLVEEVKGHTTEKAEAEADLNKAVALREKESAEYEEEAANLKSSIEGLNKAIPAIEKSAGAALLQGNIVPSLQAALKVTPDLSGWQKKVVTGFMAAGSSAGDSSEVVGILKTMLDDMTKSLADAEKGDKIAADGFASLKSAKGEQVTVAAQAINGKEKRGGELAVSIVSNENALEDAQEEKADAQKMLNTLETTCSTRKLEWEAHFKTRADEVTAISETIAMLNDDDALDIFKKAAPSALLQGGATRLLQSGTHQAAFQAFENLRLAVHRSQAAQQALRRSPAGLLQENAPEAAAPAASEKENELEKIPGHMIENLEQEHEDDAKKKEFCAAEIAKSEAAEKAKQDALEATDAELEQLTDEVATIDEEIAGIQKEIAEIDQTVAKATELRKAEHADYVESLTMADAAVALLGKAKNRLMKFYNPVLYKAPPKKEMSLEDKLLAGGSSFVQRLARKHASGAFLQLAKKQLPELPTVPVYEKKNSGGVTALLDKLSQELVMGKTEAVHDETDAQKDYVELMQESSTSRAASQKSIVAKNDDKATLETRLLEAKDSKKQTFAELTNAHELTQTLHTTCDFLLQHFEEREEARNGEVENLKAAKQLLHNR